MSFLSGCVPLRQEGLAGGSAFPASVLNEDESLVVEIDTKKEKILTGRSYAVSPQGVRYSLQVKPHDYDLERKSEKVRAMVYLCDPKGVRLRKWKNGVWTFHFVLEKEGRIRVADQKRKYWTFYYNPIIHGPPN
ncbi:MAG: hypothetical protein EOP86_17170 [Verrucomicrobiaceae bacterium]|nr:MAG: hypothetical protein EOP86_17170 [Verrucomicrobiaceae bacterium]